MFRKACSVALLVAFAGCAGVPTARAQQPAADVGLVQLSAQAQEWLAGLLRIDTTNPPGNELAAARYLAEILEREGIPAEVLESAPGRGTTLSVTLPTR